MLSRTAASLYWLGRYVERADFVARLIEATLRLDVLSPRSAGEDAWRTALDQLVVSKENANPKLPEGRKRPLPPPSPPRPPAGSGPNRRLPRD